LCRVQLAASLAATRRQADEEKTWADKVSKKQDELLETPLLEEVKARTKLGKHMEKVRLKTGGALLPSAPRTAAPPPPRGLGHGLLHPRLPAQDRVALTPLPGGSVQGFLRNPPPTSFDSFLCSQHSIALCTWQPSLLNGSVLCHSWHTVQYTHRRLHSTTKKGWRGVFRADMPAHIMFGIAYQDACHMMGRVLLFAFLCRCRSWKES
jgi:hypothetical protein